MCSYRRNSEIYDIVSKYFLQTLYECLVFLTDGALLVLHIYTLAVAIIMP
jgi:hypothetical protein